MNNNESMKEDLLSEQDIEEQNNPLTDTSENETASAHASYDLSRKRQLFNGVFIIFIASGVISTLLLLRNKSKNPSNKQCLNISIPTYEHNETEGEPLCFNYDPVGGPLVNDGFGMCEVTSSDGTFPYAKEGIALVEKGIKNYWSSIHSHVSDTLHMKSDIVIKTFFSVLSAQNGQCQVSFSALADQFNNENMGNQGIKLDLGVYQFRTSDGCSNDAECSQWSDAQLYGAIHALTYYPQTIRRIIVGNENIGSSYQLDQQMIDYVKLLKGNISQVPSASHITVGTAQTTVGADHIISQDTYQNLREELDFVGVNIYAWFSGVAIQNANSFVEDSYESYLDKGRKHNVNISITEEGWPSIVSVEDQATYYNQWLDSQVKQSRSSCLFQINDSPLKVPTGNSQEDYWGVLPAAPASTDVLGPFGDNCQGGQKTQAAPYKYITFTSDFSSLLMLLACHKDNADDCWPIGQGMPSLSEFKDNQPLKIVMRKDPMNCNDRSLTCYSRLLVLWNLKQSPVPGWCEITKPEELKDTVMINWKEHASFGECPKVYKK